MRISPPHAGHRRRSGRKTRSRSGVLDWRLAIAPLQLDCKPNRPSLPDSKLCRRSFFLLRYPRLRGTRAQTSDPKSPFSPDRPRGLVRAVLCRTGRPGQRWWSMIRLIFAVLLLTTPALALDEP